MPLSHSPSAKSIGASHHFTHTEDYERRAIKSIKNEAQKVGDMMGNAVLAVEKKMGYKPPIVPYPPHTFGQTVDYTLNYASSEISQAISHANSEVCHVIDEIREEITHHDENVEKRKKREEKEKIKRDKAEKVNAKIVAFKKKMADGVKREEVKRVGFDEKVAEIFKIKELKSKEFDKKTIKPMDAFDRKIAENFDDPASPQHGLKTESRFAPSGRKTSQREVDKSQSEQAASSKVHKRIDNESSTIPNECMLVKNHEEPKCCENNSAGSSEHSFGGKIAHFFGLEKKDAKTPTERETTSFACPFENPVPNTSSEALSTADHKNSQTPTGSELPCLTCPCKSKISIKSSGGSKTKAIKEDCSDDDLHFIACPPGSKDCCETSSLAGDAEGFNDTDTDCNTCLQESTATSNCCGPISTSDLMDDSKETKQPCPSCPVENTSPEKVLVKIVVNFSEVDRKAQETPDESDIPCSACPPESDKALSTCDEISREQGKGVGRGNLVEVFSTPPQPSPSPAVDVSETFHNLQGLKGSKFNAMTFMDSRQQSPYPPKLFTTHVTEDQSYIIHEGSNEMNPALGYIRLSWSRVSKGPVFVLGDPFLGASTIYHLKSAHSPRAQFSSYCSEKSKKAEPFFTFTFLPRQDMKKSMHSQQYTWRVALNADPASDVQKIELREGGKKDIDGRIVATWKMGDETSSQHTLFYKHPFEHADDLVMDKWITALLLTSYCATKYGMGGNGSMSL